MCGTLVVLASRVGKYDLACVNAAKTHTSFLEIGRYGFVNLSLSFEGVFYNNLIDAVTRESYELKGSRKTLFCCLSASISAHTSLSNRNTTCLHLSTAGLILSQNTKNTKTVSKSTE